MPNVSDQNLHWLLKDKYGWDAQKIAGAQTFPSEIQKDIQRLEAGEPLQYVIGWVNFLGCRIDLSYKPLIPRPETEFWTEKFIASHKKMNALEILDLCCGSGCIGIAVLRHLPNMQLDFADISARAIEQTTKNIDLNTIAKSQYRIFRSNLFEKISGRYDAILCNPPYVDPDGEVSAELLYEPTESLFAQNHGLGLIEKIISEMENHLKPDGEMWLEFGKGQEKAVEEFCRKLGRNAHIEQDQYGINRFAIMLSH